MHENRSDHAELIGQKSIARILLDQFHLDFDCHTLLTALVRQHLKLHGDDPEKSLADISSTGTMLRRSLELGDPELSARIDHVATSRSDQDTDTDATATFLGAPTSSGGRFRVLRLHAEGGLGEVYVAHDAELNREVALKEIQGRARRRPESRARFLLEAEITGGLEHPGHRAGLWPGALRRRPAVLRHAVHPRRQPQGGDRRVSTRPTALQDATPASGSLALQQAVAAVPRRVQRDRLRPQPGRLHRDLKPGNIMLGKYGETLVVDWGLAKAVGRHLVPAVPAGAEPTLRPESGSHVQPTVMGSHMGTPAYLREGDFPWVSSFGSSAAQPN